MTTRTPLTPAPVPTECTRRGPALVLATAIQSRNGAAVVEWLRHHPDSPFGTTFNILAQHVDDRADRVLIYSLRTLARLVSAGRIETVECLQKMTSRVLATNAMHFRHLARNAAARTELGSNAPGIDVDRIASPTIDASDIAQRGELLAAVLREARGVGRLHVGVAQAYRRYEYEYGTAHGAYPYIARLAVLDVNGRVVKVRSWRAGPVGATPPDTRVIRRVRAIHREAGERIRTAARRLGYNVPPAG
ncbi:hypothetical protein VT84_07570 [Gemmata sp. SH-PL17]|uniref:hypothetical protein n=1 Tax=Gemmata sp. SH-PL17 TaxID=1630693 RepID=UPI00078C2767|nr:hypothetical protein [Gemmata sp. SH-PL17]AMV24239.1 hypothetical protein VT84_07570 [Gemmata sp. SH-PL17]